MPLQSYAAPILTCRSALEFESELLRDPAAAWAAMQLAGASLARAVLQDYQELRAVPSQLRVLALVGQGHNGGDALLACAQLLVACPCAKLTVMTTAPVARMKPLAQRALRQVEGRVDWIELEAAADVASIRARLEQLARAGEFHICLDGLLGFSFKPPVRAAMRALITAVNAFPAIQLRAAVDLPSGRGDVSDTIVFHADFTYATGIAKQPCFEGNASCGRVRYLNLGFFDTAPSVPSVPAATDCVLTSQVLAPLQRLRPAQADKRSFGHLFIVGGSSAMPGALLMCVRAAVRSGVGLVTAFAPAGVVAAFAAQVPEAMWVAWPLAADGTLSAAASALLWQRLDRASALLCGPGMGRSADVDRLLQQIVSRVTQPLLLDADALQPEVLDRIAARGPEFGPVVLTPHMGEYMRLGGLSQPDYSSISLRDFSSRYRLITVLKCAHTRICDGSTVLYNVGGGPVLSRGGSGDLLAGLIGGLLAQPQEADLEAVATAVAQGVYLHSRAAECLARQEGQVAVTATCLLDFLPAVLRDVN